MLQVNLEDVKKAYEQRQLWNTTPLKDIEFMYEGKPVTANRNMIEQGEEAVLTVEHWLFTGMNNFDYMLMLLDVVDDSIEIGYSLTSEIINATKE
jgi:hypothetical protein